MGNVYIETQISCNKYLKLEKLFAVYTQSLHYKNHR